MWCAQCAALSSTESEVVLQGRDDAADRPWCILCSMCSQLALNPMDVASQRLMVDSRRQRFSGARGRLTVEVRLHGARILHEFSTFCFL